MSTAFDIVDGVDYAMVKREERRLEWGRFQSHSSRGLIMPYNSYSGFELNLLTEIYI